MDSGPDSGGTYIIFAAVLSVEWDPLTSDALCFDCCRARFKVNSCLSQAGIPPDCSALPCLVANSNTIQSSRWPSVDHRAAKPDTRAPRIHARSQFSRILIVMYFTWSLLNRFRTGQGHCNHACHKKWGFTDNELCDCGESQTMSHTHIVNSCPLTKFDGGLLRLHEADEAAVDWLTTYGS